MILVFRETDGVTGDRLTFGEAPIDDGQVLIRQGRHITGNTVGVMHNPVTVVDSASIDFTLVGQQLTGVVLLTGITHNLLSAVHPDTAAAACVRGDVIIGNATPAWQRLPIGADGTYLRSDGADVSWSTIQATDFVHNLLSVTHHGDTIPADVTRGALVVGIASPEPSTTTTTVAPENLWWSRLDKGAEGTYLRAFLEDIEWCNIQAEDIAGVQFWSRAGTTLSPTTAGDDVTTTGRIGIGIAPTYDLDIRHDQNAATTLRIVNNTAGNLARAVVVFEANSAGGVFGVYDDGFALADYADKVVLSADATTTALALRSDAAAGAIQFYINSLLDFSITGNSFNVLASSYITMADDTWIGLGAAAGRWVFDSTPAPDVIRLVDGVLHLPDGAVGSPAWAFTSNTDCGAYYTATQINWSINSAQIAYLDATGFYADRIGINEAPNTARYLRIRDQTLNTTLSTYGIDIDIIKTAGNTTTADWMYGINCRFEHNYNDTIGGMYALTGVAYHNLGTIGALTYTGTLAGLYFSTQNDADVYGDMYASYNYLYNEPGAQVLDVTAGGHGHAYVIYARFRNGGTIAQNSYMLYFYEQNAPSYCIYQNGTAISRFDGHIGIGADPTASEILNLTSTTAALLVPRMTTVQKNAIAAPLDGMIVYDTTIGGFEGRQGGAWAAL